MALDIPDELRGKSQEELLSFVERLDERLRSIHQTPAGELRDKSPEEQAEFDQGLLTRDTAIKMIEQHRKIRQAFDRRGRNVSTPRFGAELTGAVEPFDTDARQVLRMADDEARDRALRALEASSKDMADGALDRLDSLYRRDDLNFDGAALARRTLITENPEYREAWRRVMTDPRPILTQEEVYALRAFEEFERLEMRAHMAEGAVGTGGAGVPVFLDPTITLTGQESNNPYLRRADVQPVNTNKWKGVNSAGVTWSFDAEAAEVSDDSPTLGQPEATVFMARGFIPYSIEVGADYPGFAAEMTKLLAAGYEDLLIQKLTSGNGTTEPEGILTGLSSNTNVRVRVTTSGAFVVADLNKVWKALPQRFRVRSTWFSSVGVQNAVRQFGATFGANFTEDLRAPVLENLYGRPYELTDYLADTTSSTSSTQEVMIVGDFSAMLVAQRAGLTTELIPHLMGTTNGRPTGERGWFAYARVGSTTKTDLAFRLLCNTG